jgi:26S proteasome regulatory subunit N1
MSKSQDFTIKVQSEEAKKKEKPLNDKSDFQGSSKLLKDAGADESEELVRDVSSLYIPSLIHLIHTVGGRPGFEGTA